MKRFMLLFVLGILAQGLAISQEKAPENWFNLDPQKDGVRGVSAEKMYMDLLKGKSPKQKVVVAVIDSGVDAEHEDLSDVMWVNRDEIPGNGIDDDKNGYVDDIHGWNFIGGKDGKNVNHDNLEVTRLYAYYRDKFDGKMRGDLSRKEKKEYDQYMEVKAEVEEQREKAEKMVAQYAGWIEGIQSLQQRFAGEEITVEKLQSIETEDPDEQQGLAIATKVLSQGRTLETLIGQLQGGVDYYQGQLDYHYNPDLNARAVVGDDYDNVEEKYYGNNDVEGPDAGHGTHVAGIIAASRGNDLGMKGVSNAVEIMSVRAVPDGDERDKDVANAIRYAVDNGASIINMSFGKGYSWNKKVVDEAVKYAAKHDVLLVHAAGNSAQDNDNTDNFPNDMYAKRGLFGPKKAKNWLEIGALNWKGGADAPASFSNYGKKNVDLFSPGVDVYSTIPNDQYASFNGTSMASPVTAGVAAVIRSYYPELTAEQVKEVLMESTVPVNDEVKIPGGDGEMAPFSELSVTGGVVNAYNAVIAASKVKGKKKWKPTSGKGSNGSGAAGAARKDDSVMP